MKIIPWDDLINPQKQKCITFEEKSSFSFSVEPLTRQQSHAAPIALTIGVFDGIHIGHKPLLDEVIRAKTEHGYHAGIVTFTDSIFTMFKTNEKPLLPLEKRLEQFALLGFDFVFLVDFTPEIAAIPGSNFLEMLKNKCDLKYLVEGEDFRFGKNGKTDMEEIKSFCEKNGIEAKFIPPVMYDGNRVSSSLIRKMLQNCDVENAKKLLAVVTGQAAFSGFQSRHLQSNLQAIQQGKLQSKEPE